MLSLKRSLIVKKNELSKVIKAVEHIEGWLELREIENLYLEAKRNVDGGVIVEIGSWKGKSTVVLGLACRSLGRGKVYAIDPHKGTDHHKFYGTPDTFRYLKKIF